MLVVARTSSRDFQPPATYADAWNASNQLKKCLEIFQCTTPRHIASVNEHIAVGHGADQSVKAMGVAQDHEERIPELRSSASCERDKVVA